MYTWNHQKKYLPSRFRIKYFLVCKSKRRKVLVGFKSNPKRSAHGQVYPWGLMSGSKSLFCSLFLLLCVFPCRIFLLRCWLVQPIHTLFSIVFCFSRHPVVLRFSNQENEWLILLLFVFWIRFFLFLSLIISKQKSSGSTTTAALSLRANPFSGAQEAAASGKREAPCWKRQTNQQKNP